MSVLAALAVGLACALGAGALTGTMPVRSHRVARPRRHRPGGELWLRQAGVPLRPLQFWSACAGGALVAALALSVVTGSVFVAAAPSLAVGLLPAAYFGRRRQARLAEVQEAWPDGLRDLLASIGSGCSLGQAIAALADHGPAPLREAFARFPALARMLGTVPALEVVREELADPTSDRVIEVLVLAHERGGRLVGRILSDLLVATTRDLKLAAELESEGLEMRINARAVVVLPWLVLTVLCAGDGPFRSFYASAAGAVVLLVGAAASVAGVVVLARLGRLAEEGRVFGGGSP
jgi:tight adherence protein B